MANPQAAVYPARAATDLDLLVGTDAGQTVLNAAIDDTVTDIPLNSASNFTAPCLIAIGSEYILCPNDAVAGVFSGVTRGALATHVAAHANNAPVIGFFSARHFNQLAAEIKAIEAQLILTPVPRFADNETPGGAVDGVNNAFTLAHSPAPAAGLRLYRNGLLMQQGAGKDYTLAAAAITTITTPQAADVLLAFYRY
jgi:hypothetical protein